VLETQPALVAQVEGVVRLLGISVADACDRPVWGHDPHRVPLREAQPWTDWGHDSASCPLLGKGRR
jgi:hypothetical protein